MSGFDVGDVVSANLGLQREERLLDGPGGLRTTADQDLKPVDRIKVFMDFLERFTTDDDTEFPYREQLLAQYEQGEYFIEIDMDDLRSFDAKFNRSLVDWLHNTPAEAVEQFSQAAVQVVHGMRSRQENLIAVPGSRTASVSGSSFSLSEDSLQRARKEIHPIQIQLRNFGRETRMRDLHSQEVSRLVSLPGIIVSASRAQVKATRVSIMCRGCQHRSLVNVGPGFGSVTLPRFCAQSQELQAGGGGGGGGVGGQLAKCPPDPYIILADSSTYIDQQRLKLQELPEMVPTGEMPRHLSLSAEQYLVDRCKPGMRVRVLGIYSTIRPRRGGRNRGGGGPETGGAGIQVPYLRILGVEQEQSASETFLGALDPQEEEELLNLSQLPDLYERIAESIAPAIFGSEDIKKAIALQLFGGSRKLLPDGMRLRGDINVLLLGDPSVAKSQFLKFASMMAPISVYTSGKGSSAAGLTASVIRDPASGEFHLEGGALVLADGGLVCIDEFDKMREQDRVAIHEAMEQQTISIAKAGITTILNSRTSVLAAANPKFGRYNDLKTPGENIEFQTTILSRFDLIFIVRDLQNEQRDRKLAKHIISVHRNKEAALDPSLRDRILDVDLLKRYIAYARAKSFPRLSEEAGNRLKNRYVNFRSTMRGLQQSVRQRQQQQEQNGNLDGDRGGRDGGGGGGGDGGEQRRGGSGTGAAAAAGGGGLRSDKGTIPITVRQLEAIIRLSEALARLELKDVANADHVNEAVRLFKVSTYQAATSKLGEGIVGSAEFEAKVRSAELHLERRIPIGSNIAYSTILRDMTGKNFNESAVVRAVHNLVQRQKLRAYNQGKMLNRVQA